MHTKIGVRELKWDIDYNNMWTEGNEIEPNRITQSVKTKSITVYWFDEIILIEFVIAAIVHPNIETNKQIEFFGFYYFWGVRV